MQFVDNVIGTNMYITLIRRLVALNNRMVRSESRLYLPV